jgi:hypothetical protein
MFVQDAVKCVRGFPVHMHRRDNRTIICCIYSI